MKKKKKVKRALEISYHNKDIISKLMGERLQGKSLSLFGVSSTQRIIDILPTNLPTLRLKELRIDNLFLLDDGSLAIVDYESTYHPKQMLKYGRYILDILARYMEQGEYPDIHMIVIYTADVEAVQTSLIRRSMGIHIQAVYLTGIDSQMRLDDFKKKMADNLVTDEDIMKLILLPLTYKGDEAKENAIKTCIALANQLADKEKAAFALAGILAFTDKIISNKLKMHVKEVLDMTQVGKMIFDEGVEKGISIGLEQGLEQGLERGLEQGELKALEKMIKNGISKQRAMEILEITAGNIKANK